MLTTLDVLPITYNKINDFNIKYWTLRNVTTCSLNMTLLNPIHGFLFQLLIIRMCWKTSNKKDIIFRHKIMNLIKKAGNLNFQTKLWALYHTYLNPTIIKEFHG